MRGVENTIMPSFGPDMESLDEEGIRLDVRQSVDHGFFGSMCTAEAGLTFEEAKEFVGIVADEAGDELATATTVMFDSMAQQEAMMAHADEVGLDAVLLGYPPNWVPESEEEVLAVTRDLASIADVAVVLHLSGKYNFDHLHPTGLPLGVLDELADIENAVAAEVSDPELMSHVDRVCGDRLLLTSPIEGMAPGFVDAYDMKWMGAGAYEVYQSPAQPLLVDYFDDLLAGRFEEAMDTYWRLTPIRQTFMQQMRPQLQVGTYHWPLQKYYQWLSGGNGGYTRQPAMELADHQKRAIREARAAAGLDDTDDPEASFYAGRSNYDG